MTAVAEGNTWYRLNGLPSSGQHSSSKADRAPDADKANRTTGPHTAEGRSDESPDGTKGTPGAPTDRSRGVGAKGGFIQIAGAGEVGDYLDPVYEADEEARVERERDEQLNGLSYLPLRNPNADYPELTPEEQRDFYDLLQRLEGLGNGTPRWVPTPKGAPQFIFPNGMILRFDLEPGQYLKGQGPHINLENAPGASRPNEHIPLKPGS